MRGRLANETVGEFYQFARVQAMSEWWHWLLLVLVCFAALAYVVTVYRRDNVELSRSVRWLLVGLRLLAFAGVLFYFFDLEKRAERQVVQNSRVLMLVDTSQSMGLADSESSAGVGNTTRIERVVSQVAGGPLVQALRARHDVLIYRFDQESRPFEVGRWPQLSAVDEEARLQAGESAFRRSLIVSRRLAWAGGALLFLGTFLVLVHLLVRRPRARPDSEAWSLLGGVLALAVGGVVLAVAHVQGPELSLGAVLGLREAEYRPEAVDGDAEESEDATSPEAMDWSEALAARGLKTRIGDALRYLVNRERGGPIAAIVLFTDGQQNAGTEPAVAAAMAQRAEIPVYTVGLGSERRPLNVRVVDLEAPQRVFPGDRFPLTGYIQATNYPGRTVDVRLTSFPAGADEGAVEELVEAEQQVVLGEEGEIVTVRFEVEPDRAGRRTYRLFAQPPPRDHNPLDNVKTANVEVVERRNRVLLLAGGPTREYRFLRTLLYRDRDTVLDVLLQSAGAGFSQDADNLLEDFPADPEELFQYDAIVAFDPDWMALDGLQIQMLEQWVAEQAGGLVVVAGPVHTPQWAERRRGDPRWDTIRALYPVEFYTSGSPAMGLGRFGGDTAWPLDFSRDGLDAEFLWLEDEPLASEAAWAAFGGVFGYYAVKDPKPGARVYSRFSDPTTAIENALPVYHAAHFYGAGRVFFQASGEMWRIRAVDENYFDRYYTRLIRWVSQGRLLRDSRRGVLLVDKERCLRGDTVVVQALLTDAQNRPLEDPEVVANLVPPGGARQRLVLRRTPGGAREGAYTGQFTATAEGDYRIELRPPRADLEELMVAEVRSRIPALEIERPERNDALLAELAQATGGEYYVGVQATVGAPGGQPPLAAAIVPQEFVSFLPGTPDRRFDRLLMAWLMALICGALALEWLFRRLSRLA